MLAMRSDAKSDSISMPMWICPLWSQAIHMHQRWRHWGTKPPQAASSSGLLFWCKCKSCCHVYLPPTSPHRHKHLEQKGIQQPPADATLQQPSASFVFIETKIHGESFLSINQNVRLQQVACATLEQHEIMSGLLWNISLNWSKNNAKIKLRSDCLLKGIGANFSPSIPPR